MRCGRRRDDILDDEDNCPLLANRPQLDLDRDGKGDLCDDDDDDDGVADVDDNCPRIANADQRNTDNARMVEMPVTQTMTMTASKTPRQLPQTSNPDQRNTDDADPRRCLRPGGRRRRVPDLGPLPTDPQSDQTNSDGQPDGRCV